MWKNRQFLWTFLVILYLNFTVAIFGFYNFLKFCYFRFFCFWVQDSWKFSQLYFAQGLNAGLKTKERNNQESYKASQNFYKQTNFEKILSQNTIFLPIAFDAKFSEKFIIF